MKKINPIIVGLFLSTSVIFAQAAEKNNQPVLEKSVSNVSHINYSITNIQQSGHSDGYVTTEKNGRQEKLFAGTNHYKAQMEVTNNGKKVNLNIMYFITDPKVTGSTETDSTPNNIIIGQETVNKDSLVENKKVNTVPNKELEKLQSIGISKQDFDREMKLHFKSVYYL